MLNISTEKVRKLKLSDILKENVGGPYLTKSHLKTSRGQ